MWGSWTYRHNGGLEIQGEQRSSHPPYSCCWTEALSHSHSCWSGLCGGVWWKGFWNHAFGCDGDGWISAVWQVICQGVQAGCASSGLSPWSEQTIPLSNIDITIFTRDALYIHGFQSQVILYRWGRLEILVMPGWYSVNVVEGLLDIRWEGNHGWFITEPVSPHRWTGNTVYKLRSWLRWIKSKLAWLRWTAEWFFLPIPIQSHIFC